MQPITIKRHVLRSSLSFAVLAAACGQADPDADTLSAAQQAVTQITISGRVTLSNGTAVPGVPVRLTGRSQATAISSSTGNYSFTGLAPGSYSLHSEKTGCAFTPEVANLNNLTANATRNFVGSGSQCITTGPAKALVLVDSRLYAQLGSTFDTWKTLVEARRGFALDVRKTQQYDSMSFSAIKSLLVSARAANSALEGVLMVGNIKLPSFYKVRPDITQTRLLPRYYEDLDAPFTKIYGDSEIDPVCPESAPDGTKCVISPRADGGAGPVTTIRHDFDDTDFGPNRYPELWSSYMPVGVSGTSNTYTDFGNQLRPYFQKLIRFYNHELYSNGRYYLVGNNPGDRFDEVWNAFGKSNLDFYGKAGPNREVGTDCIVGSQNLCYVRWNTEAYATSTDFINAYWANPFVDEGWQQPSVFISHMNATLYDVVHVCTHGSDTWALVDTSQVRALTNAGLVAVLDGCGVAGFTQPAAPAQSGVDVSTLASDNVLLAYLYGNSKSLAAFGAPFWRGEYIEAPVMLNALKVNNAPTSSYLGAANMVRLKRMYDNSSNKYVLKSRQNEMMFGDPFIDLKP